MPETTPATARSPRSGDSLRQPRRPDGESRDHPIHLVVYRIDGVSMQALDALPSCGFRIHEADRLEEVLSLTRPDLPCDLIVIGCDVGRQEPTERLDAIRRLRPARAIAMICTNAQCAGARAVGLLRAGLSGIFPTTMGTPALASAIRLVLDGGRYAPPEMLVALDGTSNGGACCTRPAQAGEAMDERIAVLSKREREVARLLALGLANKEIAYRLDLQEVTIKVHATSIYRKLGVRNRAQAVAKLLAAGETTPSQAREL